MQSNLIRAQQGARSRRKAISTMVYLEELSLYKLRLLNRKEAVILLSPQKATNLEVLE